MRIGIIEARTDVRADISQLAYNGLGLEIRSILTVGDIQRPEQNIPTRGPDILLLGLDAQPDNALKAASYMREWNPACGIIMYGSAIAPQHFNHAMALGAKLCLSYPFDVAALSGALATAVPRTGISALPPVRPPAFPMSPVTSIPAYGTPFGSATPPRTVEPTILAMFSPKGGVGTSVLAANLAVSLQTMGHTVALVDGSVSFGTLPLLLFADNQTVRRTMIELVGENGEMPTFEEIEPLLQHHESGVSVLLAPPQPVQAAHITPDFLTHLLKTLKEHFQFVIVDTQTSYEDRELQILDVADQIIVPITAEVTALGSLKTFYDTATELLGYSEEKIIPVLMRSNTMSPKDIAHIEAVLRQQLSWRVVSDGLLVHASVQRGMPFVISDPQSEVARNVRALAAFLAGAELQDTYASTTKGVRWGVLSPILSRMQDALGPRS